MIKNFSKFLCLVEPRIFICLNREKIWLELSIKFNWCSMRSFHRTLVGFSNLWTNLSFKGFKWVSMSINLANLSKWRAKLGVWEAVFHSNSRENCNFLFDIFWNSIYLTIVLIKVWEPHSVSNMNFLYWIVIYCCYYQVAVIKKRISKCTPSILMDNCDHNIWSGLLILCLYAPAHKAFLN